MNPSVWLSLFFTLCFGTAVVTAAQWFGPTRLFPWAIGIPALVLALCQLVLDFRDARKAGDPQENPAPRIMDIAVDQDIPADVARRGTAVGLAWILFFLLSIWLVGFLIATPVFVFLYLRYRAAARTRVAAVMSGVTLFFVWGLFDQIMHTAWPEPMLLNLF